ncbi:hypothetical protein LP316_01500 [Thalassotalea sp. LPB0316]|uniref:hypothetical protein n=1 Tax=Thalassotalea sp. LPB0316 TaxID=2769490 RepID=UPI001867136A|nr:hypothetical protein [Thalassotalea sp. LPB0316]QOL26017.1 hypothetical protein LP316_01500 [Thalassotalea sp. LPB0316]
MNQQRLSRMNSLFEKVLSGLASNEEQMELKQLYRQYINFGRDGQSIRNEQQPKHHCYTQH